MAWCYEIRGSQNRLVEMRSGFANAKEAQAAGERAKRKIESTGYRESLTVVTREDVQKAKAAR